MSLGPLMVDLKGFEIDAEEREWLESPLVAGVILFKRNYANREQLEALVRDIHAVRTPPLLVAVDLTYRVAVGPRTGQKVFTLRSLAAQRDDDGRKGVAEYAGFSLHAGIGIEADAREKLERLCRYVSRPAIAAERLSLTPQGDVYFRLKTPPSNEISRRART